MDSGGPKKACVRLRYTLRHLAYMIEPSMYGGNAAFLSNYFDHFFTFLRIVMGPIFCDKNGPINEEAAGVIISWQPDMATCENSTYFICRTITQSIL